MRSIISVYMVNPPDDGWPWEPDHKKFKQGWQCPKCQKIYSPSVPECFSCNTPKEVTNEDGTGSEGTD